mmetsp:Transcript_12337/g.40542  ORF Transcript_12337/g.40542 Transcript_12337/m.40542 type:complete len:129 (-) Transcript_12337:369-755(-)
MADKASVKLFLTQLERAELVALGWSDAELDTLRPDVGVQLIQMKKQRPQQPGFSVPPEWQKGGPSGAAAPLRETLAKLARTLFLAGLVSGFAWAFRKSIEADQVKKQQKGDSLEARRARAKRAYATRR